MITLEELLSILESKIPCLKIRTVFGDFYEWKLSHLTRYVFRTKNVEELKVYSKLLAESLRELGVEIRRKHDGYYCRLFIKHAARKS